MSKVVEARAEAARLYLHENQSLRDIAETMGRSHEGVRLLLQAAGVTLRPAHDTRPPAPLSKLADEILADLGPFIREPATAIDVQAWLGDPQAIIDTALAELFERNMIVLERGRFRRAGVR